MSAVESFTESLLAIFVMDLTYFEEKAPVAHDIFTIIICAGWALLLGNLVFQAVRAMMAGVGIEGEDPKILFARTFIFSFLLVVSRQICDLGLSISKTIIELLQVPESVRIPDISASLEGMPADANWLVSIIVGAIVIWQLVRLFLEIGERYVVVAVLTILSPLAFAMGGSKSTGDIFKGWARMFGSMCLMLCLNVVLMKLLLSVIAAPPGSGVELIPWVVLVIGITRVGRKIDNIISRIGLNPAITGERGNNMVAMMALRGLGRMLKNTARSFRMPRSSYRGGNAGSGGGASGASPSVNVPVPGVGFRFPLPGLGGNNQRPPSSGSQERQATDKHSYIPNEPARPDTPRPGMPESATAHAGSRGSASERTQPAHGLPESERRNTGGGGQTRGGGASRRQASEQPQPSREASETARNSGASVNRPDTQYQRGATGIAAPNAGQASRPRDPSAGAPSSGGGASRGDAVSHTETHTATSSRGKQNNASDTNSRAARRPRPDNTGTRGTPSGFYGQPSKGAGGSTNGGGAGRRDATGRNDSATADRPQRSNAAAPHQTKPQHDRPVQAQRGMPHSNSGKPADPSNRASESRGNAARNAGGVKDNANASRNGMRDGGAGRPGHRGASGGSGGIKPGGRPDNTKK